MQNRDDKQRQSMSDSVDQSNERKNDSSKHSSPERERSHDPDQADQSSYRRDYDKDRGPSRPDDQSHRSQGEHSSQGQSRPQK
jgi:hypothetical protein